MICQLEAERECRGSDYFRLAGGPLRRCNFSSRPLSTVGEATEKQFHRISGDILGGICALAAIVWISLQFLTIAGLTVVVAVVALAGHC